MGYMFDEDRPRPFYYTPYGRVYIDEETGQEYESGDELDPFREKEEDEEDEDLDEDDSEDEPEDEPEDSQSEDGQGDDGSDTSVTPPVDEPKDERPANPITVSSLLNSDSQIDKPPTLRTEESVQIVDLTEQTQPEAANTQTTEHLEPIDEQSDHQGPVTRSAKRKAEETKASPSKKHKSQSPELEFLGERPAPLPFKNRIVNCTLCYELFDKEVAGTEDACVHHPGKLELWDPDYFGEDDGYDPNANNDHLKIDCPEAYRWTCCTAPPDLEPCTTGWHKRLNMRYSEFAELQKMKDHGLD